MEQIVSRYMEVSCLGLPLIGVFFLRAKLPICQYRRRQVMMDCILLHMHGI